MQSVGIIGGGIIGLCSAWFLRKAGYEVTVLDKGDFTDGCSYGNAGMIVPSHIIPLAAPGVIRKGLSWLFDPSSPLAIKPDFDLGLIRWLFAFYLSATPKKVNRATPHLAAINLLSKALYQQLTLEAELDFQLKEKGILMLYKSAKTEKEELKLADIANGMGIRAQAFSSAEVAKFDPNITYDIKGAIYFPGDAHIHPGGFMSALKSVLKQQGVRLISNKRVDQIQSSGKKIKSISSNGASFSFDQYLICSGVWSNELVKKLGINIPLVSGKGYSFMVDNDLGLHIPSLLLDHKVSVTPMEDKLRFGGTMELGKPNAKIKTQRLRGIVGAIQQYYPQLKVEMPKNADIWCGHRPCSPDGLPFIGKLNGMENLTVATGHGMMGLSLGPATGKLVSQVIKGEQPDIDITAFDVNRFN